MLFTMNRVFLLEFLFIVYVSVISGHVSSLQSNSNIKEMCSKGVDKAIRREYDTYINVLTNILNDYDKLSNTALTISCQIDLRTVILNFTKAMDMKIKEIVTEINVEIKQVEKLVSSEIDVITAIREGDFCAARYQLLEQGDLSLSQLIPIVYGKNSTNAEKIILFLNSLPNVEDTIFGYRILFDEMKKTGHLYSTVTSSIAYQVLNVLHTSRSNNEDYIYIRDNLPASFKTFPWNSILIINNIIGNEPLFGATQDNYKYDDSRRYALTYKAQCLATNCQWKFIPESNGTFFYIKNTEFSEFLYADSNELALDNQRRHVFTWKRKDVTLSTGHWQLEPIEGSVYFKIKNLYWNEYMYVDTYKFVIDNDCRHVFTWRPGGCEEEGCKWKFTRL